jgi:hypothetical protein
VFFLRNLRNFSIKSSKNGFIMRFFWLRNLYLARNFFHFCVTQTSSIIKQSSSGSCSGSLITTQRTAPDTPGNFEATVGSFRFLRLLYDCRIIWFLSIQDSVALLENPPSSQIRQCEPV